eukprot:CAMPEP_0206544998 /NCGR_PEP_ID=MMETSP0325_2-20121206/11870_1 /ASSEMBLY_ACC=CAM_ASM_000347 /TAXON_ID=2866 /ORGANISM="Crypthecodinium cohnii, Strain Seligo" /LENGTH=386 /DNA_ID=CAMNT_0054043891 /DNA_START=81 /DNA_END=1240 /DNA_ORIENTATION=+
MARGRDRQRRRRRGKTSSGEGHRSRSRPSTRDGGGRRRKEVTHFEWTPGMRLGEKRNLIVQESFGEGNTGRVLSCLDEAEGNRAVAVKVSRATRREQRHSEQESQILQMLQDLDKEKTQKHIIHLYGTFIHDDNHFCQVLEPLPTNLRGFMGLGENEDGIFLADIQVIAKQILNALAFLHSASIVHTDLKNTNVMLREADHELLPHPRVHQDGAVAARPLPRAFSIVLIDFGMATAPPEAHATSGAPEVTLSADWEYRIDIWSLGVMLYSLYSGIRLFPVHEDAEHLALMEHTTGKILPVSLLEGAGASLEEKGVYLTAEKRLIWPDGPVGKKVLASPTLQDTKPEHQTFLKFVRKCLQLDYRLRPSAASALNLEFVTLTEEDIVE